eukprot:GHVN01010163.1.p1 GENE.GHVN01010163.1~~GHVN01010163.1.p1  ORF type:complete len:357 (-),score=38.75 GHVN01010163.1:833-1903(-)
MSDTKEMTASTEPPSPPLIEIESNYDEAIESFEDLNLKEGLLRGIFSYGYEKPSSIQQRGIKPIIDGCDTIGQAQSGTGKTATFAIGALQKVDVEKEYCQALILAPTRELAQQIQKVTLALGEYLQVRCHACVGGTSVMQDQARLRRGQHVVVGTPGRVKDMMERQCFDPRHIRLFILDEADEMLVREFKSQIYDVFQYLPHEVQVALFSATMPPAIFEITEKFMRDPKRILVKKDELTLEGIRQFYINVGQQTLKFDTLIDLYEQLSLNQTIVYCNSRRNVDNLSRDLDAKDFTVASIHGEMQQRNRDVVMQQFRSSAARILVTTDLLSRGIDVQQVSIVINYDLPISFENYIHR